MWENMAVAAIRQIILTKTYKRKYARHFCMRQLRLLRHFVRNSLNLWALQLYQVSQLSHEIFVVCLFFQELNTAALNGSFLHDQTDHFDQVRANLVNLVNLVT